jgi:hypothetical protein
MRDALLRQFPRGERCALATRPGLVAEHVELPAAPLRLVQRRGGGADIDGRQPAGVAVREHPEAILDQLGPVPADGGAVRDILLGELFGGGDAQRLLFLHRFAAFHDAPHLEHRVHRIDRRGPGLLERLQNPVEVGGELLQITTTKRLGALGQTVGGRRRDGRRAAHDHVANGARRFAEVARPEERELMREQALLDEFDDVGRGLKGDGAVMAAPAANGDLHGASSSIPLRGVNAGARRIGFTPPPASATSGASARAEHS